MKIDRNKLKKSTSDVPSDCRQLIDRLKSFSSNESALLAELKSIKTWNYGKSELYHWIDVLDMFDSILERPVKKDRDTQWSLPCDSLENESLRELLIHVILFTSLLIEHSFSRHLYNSMEYLTTLLSSSDMSVVLAVLNLLYVFSKRSNFISRLNSDRKSALIQRLNYLAESWGGKENGFGLAECCQDLSMSSYPSSATTLHFEFYSDENKEKSDSTTSSTITANAPTATSSSSLPGSSTKSSSKAGATLSSSTSAPPTLTTIHIESVYNIRDRSIAQIMEDLVDVYNVPRSKQMLLFTHLRLAHSFSNYRKRLQCVQARLQALSIIVYCNAMSISDGSNNILYNGFIEELVEVLELKVPSGSGSGVSGSSSNTVNSENVNKLLEIKAAALRTLTSVIHLDHSSKLSVIIDATGASLYHGFLPSLVRSCIQALIDGNTESFPLPFATALFSFLYHLGSYENGGEALVSCGMIESLVKVISWKGTDPEHITFVTRAVRVIDLITNLDMSAFQTHNGLNKFIKRLEYEIDICRHEQPFVIDVPIHERFRDQVDEVIEGENGGRSSASSTAMDVSVNEHNQERPDVSNNESESGVVAPLTEVDVPQQTNGGAPSSGTSGVGTSPTTTSPNNSQTTINKDVQCYPQRAALLKSMLNFLKKAIQDPAFSDNIRHLMDGSLPSTLRHIISNAEYYGPSLFMLATDVVTVYVFQEPSLLSTLQETGLTDVVLQALLTKPIPPTREVISSLPNVFSALCLNSHGLESFRSLKPFDKVFSVLLSNDYLPAMRRRRSSDPMGDTASNLGTSMDELMRHQPSIRSDATTSIINLLNELCRLGTSPNYVCSKSSKYDSTISDGGPSTSSSHRHHHHHPPPGNDGGSSDEDDDDDEDGATNPTPASSTQQETGTQQSSASTNTSVDVVNGVQSNNEQIVGVVDPNKPSTSTGISESPKVPVPLVDYILNVMRFVDAILSNNSTDDHCQEFVKQKGLTPLLRILLLPNLPIDFPTSQACISVASVAKSILTLAHEKEVLREGLKLLNEVLAKLDPIHRSLSEPGGSVLLEELIEATSKANSTGQDPFSSAVLTPLLHAMSAAHAMIVMFVHVSRTGQNDVRNLSVTHWGSEAGIAVLNKLSLLYTSLVWESTILLAMCSSATPSAEPLIDSSWKFGKHQLEKLSALIASKEGKGESGITTASVEGESVMEVDGEQQPLTGSSSSQTVVSKSKSSTSTSTSKSSSSSKLSPHIKQIKPLLTSASRLGRVLAELFGILVKLCVGTPLRHRRHQHMPNLPMPPSPSARAIASALSKLLTNRLSWQPPPTALPIPRFRLTFYICSVGFTSPMLFDERKYPFHLMLQQFVKHGGQKAFFDTFYWAITQGGKVEPTEGIEHPELPDGTGEFLDAWLLLLEKMVNPKTILESPHSLPTTSITGSSSLSSFTPFDPVRYLIRTHKRAFECIMYLWNKKPLKTYGERMSETILTILCHLLKGESIIKEKLAKEKEDSIPTGPATGSGTAANSGTTGPSRQARRTGLRDDPEELGINPDHLQQLMDMGFARPLCIEALSMTNSLEQATDYCLSNPGHVGIPELDMNEEDAMSRAIAISLGEDGSGAVITAALRPTGAAAVGENGQPIVGTSSGATTNFNETEKKEPENEQPPPPALEEEVEDNDPIPKVVIDEFVKDILPGCLKLLDELPETVYRVCDLLIAVATREKSNKSSDDDSGVSVKSESDDWMRHVFRQLIQEISNNISILIKATEPMTSSDKRTILEWASQLTTIPEAMKAATRIHVFSLLFEERRNECASLISETNLIESLVHLLEATQNTMSILLNHLSSESASGSTSTTTSGTTTTQVQTPKWLAPVILLIDLYDKAAIASVRRSPCLYFTRRQWKWFDDRTGKWTSYTSANNKTIDDAYKSGESHVRFVSGRRKYTIQYSNMVQVNEESGSWRPIMFVNDTEKKPEGPSVSGSSTTNKDDNAMEGVTEGTTEGMTASSITSVPSEATSPTIEAKKFRTINGLDLSQCSSLIRSSVGFINIPVDSDTLHAVMRLVLRLTRNYDMAASFAELGGVRAMLSLTQRSAFTGFNSLATLIIRHILEEPLTLRQTMEKVIRSTVHHSPMSFKEMHYILRILAPAACRDTILFSDVIKQTVRIALPALTKREEDDTRLQSPNAVQLLKLLGGSSSAIGPSGAIGSTTTDKTGTTSLTTISRENSSKIIKSLICDLLNALAIKVPTVTPTPPKPSISSTVTTPTDETKDVATSSTSGLPGTAPDGVQNAPPSLDQSSPPIGHPQIAICPPAPVEGNVQVVEDIDEDSSENAEESVDFAVGPFESSSGSAVVGGSSSGTTTIKFTIPIFGSKEEMDARRNRPLLTQSSLLRLLAELSKSYPIVAKIIAEYSYTAGQAELDWIGLDWSEQGEP